MYSSAGKNFPTIHDYFDHICETIGYPRVHEVFSTDRVRSTHGNLHLNVYEHDPYAPTVVFLPGTALYALCYGELLHKLGQSGFNVIGFDPRGHGQSDGPRGDYTIEELMDDCRAVVSYAIQRFNPNVSLMGSSQGGIVALYMAAADSRLRSVICHCLADLGEGNALRLTRHPALSRYLRGLLRKAGDWMPEAQIPISTYIDFEKIPVRHFGNAKRFMETDPLVLKSVSLRALKSLAGTPLPVPLEEIRTPVMVVQGTHDHIFPVHYTQSIFNRLQCKKRMELYEGKSHALFNEDADMVAPHLVEWLRETGS